MMIFILELDNLTSVKSVLFERDISYNNSELKRNYQIPSKIGRLLVFLIQFLFEDQTNNTPGLMPIHSSITTLSINLVMTQVN